MLEGNHEPFGSFARWYADAVAAEPDVPDAMQLATVDAAGNPSVRTVLLKEHGPSGWVFYTHYSSPKGRDLTTHPRAAAVMHWKSLQRQVRVEGPVERLPAEASDRYFATRDRASQIGAWASDQSSRLADRSTLDAAFEAVAARFSGHDVPRPPHWGGWTLQPTRMEFWQGRPGRLHDRVLFELHGPFWERSILAP